MYTRFILQRTMPPLDLNSFMSPSPNAMARARSGMCCSTRERHRRASPASSMLRRRHILNSRRGWPNLLPMSYLRSSASLTIHPRNRSARLICTLNLVFEAVCSHQGRRLASRTLRLSCWNTLRNDNRFTKAMCQADAGMAEAYDVAIAPHCPLSPIALAASLQLDFCTPNAFIREQSRGIHNTAWKIRPRMQ